ncbi:MAG: PEP-utilizing enzyme [Burkholderiales bacterium]|nr:PEP-utilizing enzyme [Burkholderiales bacterium]
MTQRAASYVIGPGPGAVAVAVGGKAAALNALARAEFPVPRWFAVRPEAFRASLPPEAAAALDQAGNWDAARAVLGAVAMPRRLLDEIETWLMRLGGADRVAVRSSAIDEDSSGHSFAGQLESFLYVPREAVPARIVDVWRSAFTERVLAYRREHGLALAPRAPGVLVQAMVDADAAGVAFSADPVSGARAVRVVSAVFGLGTALVSGEADADTWRIGRDGAIRARAIATKRIEHRIDAAAPAGVSAHEVDADRAAAPAIADDLAVEVARLAARAEHHFGRPQDIEWAVRGAKVYLLQSRPITTLAALADPEGERIIWDNSNIVESYGGVTSPFTYSFARRAYEEVYREFCRLMGVPRWRIESNRRTFRNMLGLIRGRVYYNLNSWYRTLALLPGYRTNRRFMEQMMGVRESIPEQLADALAASVGGASRLARAGDALLLARTVAGLVYNHLTVGRRISAFHARLERVLAEPPAPLADMRIEELVAHYRDLERRLLTRWDAPLVNDFLAMIFYGVLRRLTQKWCGDADGTLQNNLLCGEGGMVSAEPARLVREMAETAAEEPELARFLAEAPADELVRGLARFPAFRVRFDAYVARFGDRCLEELKLESPSLHEDPTTLLRSVASYARRGLGGERASAVERRMRATAEEEVGVRLRDAPLRRTVFRWVLANARARVRDRENLRFERTRVFGRVRAIALELGRRLAALDRLEAPRDVFFLEVEELLGFVEGTATAVDLAALARVRKSEFARFAELPPPADRFETTGAVHQGNAFAAAHAPPAAGGDVVRGTGACPGVVRARVRVVHDPRNAALEHGEILVARYTDPGWIVLFPSCAGLLVERGSLLSHSAIVAREMAIPAIVGLAGVTHWLATGDLVEMDGTTGTVRKVSAGAEAAA